MKPQRDQTINEGENMFIRKCFNVVSFCFLLTLSRSVFSQIVLEGVVTDNGSDPVQNALVTLTDQADPIRIFSDYTDETGQYSIQITETGVDVSESRIPGVFNLSQNYPNPFNPSTVIDYDVPRPSHIRIEIYNILGQKIKTLFDGFQTELIGRIVWDATDELGRGVSAGVYICSLNADGIRIHRKMLLVDGHSDSAIRSSQSEHAAGTNQNALPKTMSNEYTLRVTGDDIETYEQSNLEITENTVLNISVTRTVTDIDGNVYRTVKIGDQWWMAENLKVTHYQNGDAIPNVTDDTEWSNLTTGAFCDYDNEADSAEVYGHLFNWHVVNDIRGIAPESWHVPSETEWQTLIDYLGGDEIAGSKMKEAGTTHWLSPNTGATNESGFTALPCGCRFYNSSYSNMGNATYFWSSTEYNSSRAWLWLMYYDYTGVNRDYLDKRNGFSVRCVKD
jgi:uncharacterized protein (TIGR02145 family)